MTAPLCFVDTESDGLHPGRKAWEVALVRREETGVETAEHFFLSIDLSTADVRGLRVGGFYERHPMGRRISQPAGAKKATPVRPITSAAALIARMTHGARIVGAVPSFDAEILDRLLRENGLTPAWHYRLICVETLTAGHLRRDIGGLDACAEALDLPPLSAAQRHTALGDTLQAKAIYDAVMGVRPTETAA